MHLYKLSIPCTYKCRG